MMSRALSTILLSVLAAGAISCSEEVPAMVASIQYTACTGRHGTCGAGEPGSCCARSEARFIGESYDVDCVIVRGALEGSYVLDFEVSTPRNDDPALFGNGLRFSSTATSPAPIQQCRSFAIREGGNYFQTESCDNLDFGGDSGGGCEVYLWINEEDTVEGQFQCKELPLGGGQNTVFSTIRGGGVDWGSLRIEHCSLRL